MQERTGLDWTEPLPEDEGGVIAGAVADFEGVALTGVRVEVAGEGGADLGLLPVLTDGEGRFRLTGLAEGRYDLRFVLGGVKARTLAVPAGKEDLDVRLARPLGILLVVKTEASRAPPDLLHVVLDRETPKGVLREHVGRLVRSRALLWGIRPGRYTLTVWGGPYLPVIAAGVEVVEGRPSPEVEVLLGAEGGAVAGRLLGADGEPAPGLVGWRRLEAPGPWPRTETSCATGPGGRFAIRGLPAGRYLVFGGPEEGPYAEATADVVEERETRLDLRPPPEGSPHG